MKNLTAILISFLRPEYTMECVRSLREVYPDINIFVGENGHYNEELKNYVNEKGGKYFLMPYDSGVCFARNRLMSLVSTDYVLVGDDDFYYIPDPGVKKMVTFLENNQEMTLIGGRIYEMKRVLDYQGNIEIYDDHLEYKHLDPEKNKKDQASGLQWQQCDITFNFFVARKKDIKNLPWDEKIKVAFEHSDWFISLKKAGINVAYTPDIIVTHKPSHVQIKSKDQYMAYRMRRSDMSYFFTKHKLKYSIGFRGIRTNSQPLENANKRFYAKHPMYFEGKSYNAGDIIETDNPNEHMVSCW